MPRRALNHARINPIRAQKVLPHRRRLLQVLLFIQQILENHPQLLNSLNWILLESLLDLILTKENPYLPHLERLVVDQRVMRMVRRNCPVPLDRCHPGNPALLRLGRLKTLIREIARVV